MFKTVVMKCLCVSGNITECLLRSSVLLQLSVGGGLTSFVTPTGQGSAEVRLKYTCATTSQKRENRPENSGSRQRSNSDNDDDDMNNAGVEVQDAVPPVFDRSPPPELEGFPDIPDPNVLGIGGLQNVIARGRGHAWGGGVRLGAVEHNPHVIEPVLKAQSPGESAVRRLEMRQHQQLHQEAGIMR